MAAAATLDGAPELKKAPLPKSAAIWKPKHNPWAIALTVTLATFMEVLDTSIANVSLPHIAGNLSVSTDESAWVLTSYLVSNAIVLPISGWISNRIGRKRFYMTCVALFTLSSLLCGFAPSIGWLVFFRILQGVGGGGLAPSEQSILADTFEPAQRGMAFAMYGMAVVLAPAIGPTLGGYITDNFNWRWIFFINVPVGLFSLYMSNRMVEDPPHVVAAKGKSGSIDLVGLGLIAIGLGSLEVVLDKGQEEGWFDSQFIVGFTISAAVSLVAAGLWEWNTRSPIVDLRLYKDRTFAVCSVLMLTLGLALFGSTILLPQFLQTLLGYSATDSGMVLSPGGVLIIFMMPFVGKLVSKVDPRKMIVLGFVITSSSLILMAHMISTSIDFKTAMLLRCFQASGLAFLFVPINTIAYAEIPADKRNAASGIVNLARNMGGDIGIALVTTIIARRTQFHQSMLATHASVFDPAFRARVDGLAHAVQHATGSEATAQRLAYGTVYRGVQGQAATLAFVDALYVLGVACAFMIPLVFLAKAPKVTGEPSMAH
jgi:DHA2 family multidrug resistance protein